MKLSIAEIAFACNGVLSKNLSLDSIEQLTFSVEIDSRNILNQANCVDNTYCANIHNKSSLLSTTHATNQSKHRDLVYLFVAIKGQRFDGHAFIHQVAEFAKQNQRKCCFLINKNNADTQNNIDNENKGSSYNCDTIENAIMVDNTLDALGKIAKYYRRCLVNTTFIGITGSNGKTTLKEMLYQICKTYYINKMHKNPTERHAREHNQLVTHLEINYNKNDCISDKYDNNQNGYIFASSGNFNNHIGMPLNLLKIQPHCKIAILELGMSSFGEIKHLSNILKPNIAIINNAMHAHIGNFNSVTEIAQAKCEIFYGMDDISSNIACINFSDKHHNLWLEYLKKHKPQVNIFAFGAQDDIPSDVLASHKYCYYQNRDNFSIEQNKNHKQQIYSLNGVIEFKLQLLGKHNIENCAAVSSLALCAGCDFDSIALGINSYKGYARRLEVKTSSNEIIIVDDTYNANLDSVKAAILAIKSLPKPHYLILGDLKELGYHSQALHQEIGIFAYQNGIDYLFTIGEQSRYSNAAYADLVCPRGQPHNALTYSKEQNKHENLIYNTCNNTNLTQVKHFDNISSILTFLKLNNNLIPNSTILVKGSNAMNLSNLVDQLVIIV